MRGWLWSGPLLAGAAGLVRPRRRVYDWYEDERPMRRRVRPRSVDRELSAASLEERLDELRDELRRMEVALAELGRPAEVAPREK